jgi:hypothetical protein
MGLLQLERRGGTDPRNLIEIRGQLHAAAALFFRAYWEGSRAQKHLEYLYGFKAQILYVQQFDGYK